jgi:hypothetical protein
MIEIKESDWKKFKPIRDLALERFCEKVLLRTRGEIDKKNKSAHERYLSIYKLIHEEDKDLGRLFNDFRRSIAISQLTGMIDRGLVTESEIETFSDELKERLKIWFES